MTRAGVGRRRFGGIERVTIAPAPIIEFAADGHAGADDDGAAQPHVAVLEGDGRGFPPLATRLGRVDRRRGEQFGPMKRQQ